MERIVLPADWFAYVRDDGGDVIVSASCPDRHGGVTWSIPHGVPFKFGPGSGMTCATCGKSIVFSETVWAVPVLGEGFVWLTDALVDGSEEDLRALLVAAKSAIAAERGGDRQAAANALFALTLSPGLERVIKPLAELAQSTDDRSFSSNLLTLIVAVVIAILKMRKKKTSKKVVHLHFHEAAVAPPKKKAASGSRSQENKKAAKKIAKKAPTKKSTSKSR